MYSGRAAQERTMRPKSNIQAWTAAKRDTSCKIEMDEWMVR